MKIIGQEKLLNKLNSYTLATLPKTIMFLGEVGCGKTFFANNLAERFELEVVEINEKVTEEQLIEYNQCPVPKFYLIDLELFDQKQQNQFLKFIEEPAESVYIILMARSEINILQTILNRCIKFHFEPYTKDQLNAFAFLLDNPDPKLFDICPTPGLILNADYKTFPDLCKLCNTIIDKINLASYANTISISLKINYKEEYSKFNFDMFFTTLEYLAFEKYKNTGDAQSLKIYKLTNNTKQLMLNKTLAKESYMLNFLTTLWKETR